MQPTMNGTRPFARRLAGAAVAVVLVIGARSDAFHFYRGNGAGECGGGAPDSVNYCCPESDPLGDAPTNVAAVVDLLHNSFNDRATKLPVVRIHAGEQVQWRWASSHCHSVASDTPGLFDSGLVYPAEAPEGQSPVIPGFLEYPLPDESPKLTYTVTFDEPGTYPYHCIHHRIIGMEGVVIVDP